ncbi:acyltransferase [Methylobacter sp. sgz302048]|uniref:acyltransferase n=1 Tax=Methylobacter sp. sgz302048 TaxID=3455945 RepID=UPI003F9F0B8A
MRLFRRLLKLISFKTGRFKRLYVKICSPSGSEYANFLKKWGGFYSIGNDCHIWPYTNITDPAYTRLGNNVMLTACTILGHDGSIDVLNRAYGKKLDRVGKVDIKDNVFIGHGAIVLPGVTIGPNTIVGAGSVVTKDIPEGVIAVGNPAKPIGKTYDLVEKLEKQTKELPWAELIQQREGSFDAALEPELKRLRAEYFFND